MALFTAIAEWTPAVARAVYHTVIFGLFLLAIGLMIWSIVNHFRTETDRRWLVSLVPMGAPGWHPIFACLEQFDYGDHFWARMLFRDPFRLYAEPLRSLIIAARSPATEPEKQTNA